MTELQSVKVNSAAEVSDIKKARMLMQSVIDSNPALASGYIGLSRLEKDTGRLKEAREVIMRGCERCASSEDVWMEAALAAHGQGQPRHPGQGHRAAAHVHQPVDAGVQAGGEGRGQEARPAPRARAHPQQHRPVEGRHRHGGRGRRARPPQAAPSELVPESGDMWLAYARLSPYEDARAILNRARRAVPTDSSIWITAAKARGGAREGRSRGRHHRQGSEEPAGLRGAHGPRGVAQRGRARREERRRRDVPRPSLRPRWASGWTSSTARTRGARTRRRSRRRAPSKRREPSTPSCCPPSRPRRAPG